MSHHPEVPHQPDFQQDATVRPGGYDQPMNKGLMAVGAIAVAGLSAAIGWYGVQWLTASDGDPIASPTTGEEPAAATVPLTFDLATVETEAVGLFTPPACGEHWTAEPTPAHGVIPEVTIATGATRASATVAFTNDNDQLAAFLAQEGQLIITRDDVVVTPDWGSEFVPELFVTTPEASTPTSDVIQFTGATLCDTAQQLAQIWDDFDWESATEAEIAQGQRDAQRFESDNAALPPGEYKVYAWTPVIMGEPAAAARALAEEGITGLAYLQYTAGYSPIQDDPRIQQYCTESQTPDGQAEMLCDVPPEVITDVLTRDVPVHYVVEADAAVTISEPATFTVE